MEWTQWILIGMLLFAAAQLLSWQRMRRSNQSLDRLVGLLTDKQRVDIDKQLGGLVNRCLAWEIDIELKRRDDEWSAIVGFVYDRSDLNTFRAGYKIEAGTLGALCDDIEKWLIQHATQHST